MLLHLRETEGDYAILDVPGLLGQTGAVKAEKTNVLGEEIGVEKTNTFRALRNSIRIFENVINHKKV